MQPLRIDERNHVEKPLLDQLAGLGWEIFDLDHKQRPADSFRDSFAEVVMLPVLREQLKVINPWLEEDQVEEAVRRLTVGFPSTGLLENNRHVFDLLLSNTSVSENRQTGERSPTVRFADFEQPENNRFIVVCQYKVRIPGTEHHIIPDIVLFLNGLPVVVIECKSPKVKDAIAEAIDQILRYGDQRGASGEGSARLFYYNQFVVATCRQEAKFGTITTRGEKYFYRWADPYPRTVDVLEHGAGGPNDQQRLVAGMLDRGNLLDLVRTYTLFSVNDKSETIKIVGRYQQFRAVKLAVKRLLEGRSPRGRSGIVWHTQGSGKSLTMMFMVREMYRHVVLSGWKVVFVTDRTQLERQLSETSRNVGFTVKVADNIPEAQGAPARGYVRSGDGHDPQVPGDGSRGSLPRTQRQPAHPRHDRRGAPVPIPDARRQPRPGDPQRDPDRLHRHADRQDRAGVRRLHRQVHHAPVDRGRRDAPNHLRGPHPQGGSP